ncbi:restriction endonuclease [Chitinophaga sp. RCC_12]|uniref:restriction endonuclease n=1 Tax=Chitinophaga sp. RCC_12 TaxID=3239226 RepID=UPI003524ED71
MRFTKEDIKFEEISPLAFENLCYDLLINYNFRNLIWRQGAGDNGRDIEGTFTFLNTIKAKETKWFFECKHYTSGGVPPEHLNSKIAWADAERPDFLVLFMTSYPTTGGRVWLDKLIEQKKMYDIIIIEGEDLKERLLQFPELIERYFSTGRYVQMLATLKDYKNKYQINPSYEVLKEIVLNIDLAKLDTKDLGFILLNFYNWFDLFKGRKLYNDDFDEDMMNRILDYMEQTLTHSTLDTFSKYKGKYEVLGGIGFIDEYERQEYVVNKDSLEKYDFQYWTLHLNHKLDHEHWQVGEYLIILYEGVAFEIFHAESTEIRIIKDFAPECMNEISLDNPEEIRENYLAYLALVGNLNQ